MHQKEGAVHERRRKRARYALSVEDDDALGEERSLLIARETSFGRRRAGRSRGRVLLLVVVQARGHDDIRDTVCWDAQRSERAAGAELLAKKLYLTLDIFRCRA